MFGIWYFITPRLTGRRIWSELLGNILFVGWNVSVLVGVILIALAHTQSREYAEMVWGVDVAVMVMLVLHARQHLGDGRQAPREEALRRARGSSSARPSGCRPCTPSATSIWHPPEGALQGINDAVWGWFYGHNVLGLWFTTGFLGIFYYVLPKEVNTPLYSVKLSLVSFWGTVLFYTGVGGHHILWAPVPDWLKTTAIAESIGMVLPVTAFLINLFMTMRGNWNRVFSSIAAALHAGGRRRLRGRVVPGDAHGLARLQLARALLAVRARPLAPRPALLLRLLRAGRHVLRHPAAVRLPALQPPAWATCSGCSTSVGFTFFFIGFVLAGLVQGSDWVNIGMPVWSVLPAIRPYMALRIFGGALMYVSFWLFLMERARHVHRAATRPERPETPVRPPRADRHRRRRSARSIHERAGRGGGQP